MRTAIATIGASVVVSPAPAQAAETAPRKCGFAPVAFRTVSDLEGSDCASAKRVLLRLRGERDTIPMVCGNPEELHGWRLTPGPEYERSWSAVMTRYSRGEVSFVYTRTQNARRVWCPPVEPVGEGV